MGRHEFGYDPAGRLATETHPAAGAVPSGTYSYDVMGNRTSGPGSPAGSTSSTATTGSAGTGRSTTPTTRRAT